MDEKALLHAKRWDLYLNEKEKVVKGKYLVVVVGHCKKNVLWEVFRDHVVEDPCDNENIGLRGFDFNIFDSSSSTDIFNPQAITQLTFLNTAHCTLPSQSPPRLHDELDLP